MPYDAFKYNSVEDAWNNRSVFNQTQDKEKEEQIAAAVQQAGLLNSAVQQQPIPAMAAPQPQAPASTATQIVTQGGATAARKPTAQEYEMSVIDYLMNKKGYSFEDAQNLMAPDIARYKMQEQIDNRNQADALAAQLDRTPIDSPEYRAGALQLMRLDPAIGGLYMKDGIGRREMYMRGLNRQDRRDDMAYNANFQLQNQIQRMQAMEAIRQQQAQNKYNLLISLGYKPEQAAAAVYGIGGRGYNNANGAASGGVSKDDYSWADKTVTGLMEELDALRAENPNAQLSPEKQQLFRNASAIMDLANQQRMIKYGLDQKQQKQQPNINDYSVLKRMIQAAIQQNGGKFDKNVAMAIRKRAGLDPNNTNPKEWVNEIFKNEYDYRG